MAASSPNEIVCTISPVNNFLQSYTIFINRGNQGLLYIVVPKSNRITVLQQSRNTRVLQYPSEVVDVCVGRADDVQSAAYILTQCGVWRYRGLLGSDDKRMDPEPMDTGPDIFSDLLQDPEMIQTQAQGKGDTESSTKSCNHSVRIMNSPSGSKSLALFNSTLLILIQNGNDWFLSYYQIQKEGSRVDHQCTSRLGTLCLRADSPSGNDLKTEIYQPKLYILLPSHSKVPVNISRDKIIPIAADLFSHFFGLDSSLSCSPVCLVTSQSGIIYGQFLHSQNNTSNHPEVVMEICQPIVAIVSLTVTLKMVLGDPKLTIHRPTPDSMTEHSGNCLLIISEHGLLSFTLSLKSPVGKAKTISKIIKQTCLVKGPVKCVEVCNNLMIHSTGRELYLTDLAPMLQRLMESEAQLDTCLPLESWSQGVANVVDICTDCAATPRKGLATEVPCTIVTSKGRVMRHLATRDRTTRLGAHHSPDGSTVKDVLTGITRVSDLMTTTNDRLKLLDVTLYQLHIATLIATIVGDSTQKIQHSACNKISEGKEKVILKDTESPIAISCMVKCTEKSSNSVSYRLEFKLSAVKVTINEGWSLLVHVHDQQGLSEKCQKFSKMVSLCRMAPGEFMNVNVDLDNVHLERCHFPISVDIQLIYTLPNSISNPACTICMPLPRTNLDILCFLRKAATNSRPSSGDSVEDTLMRMAKTRACYSSHTSQQGAGQTMKNDSLSSAVVVPEGCVKHYQLKSASDILKWLVNSDDDDVGVTIRLCTVDNHQVSLSVHSPGGSTYTVTIQTEHRRLLSLMELCLTNKFKEFEERPTGTLTRPSLVQVKSALDQIQGLQRDIEKLQQRPGSDTSNTVSLLLNAHHTLKQIQI